MFDREGKREKILEVRNKEIRLKLKTKASNHAVLEEQKAKEQEQAVFADKTVQAAETEFFEVIRKQLEKRKPQEELEEVVEVPPPEPEPVIEEEPPPPPPPPAPEPKKGKKKGKEKKGKEKKKKK